MLSTDFHDSGGILRCLLDGLAPEFAGMRRNLIICLLLAGITLALYWPMHNYDLVYYDDPLFLTESPEIQSGLNRHSFIWAFSSVIIANWHPMTTLSFVIDHQLFGTNPGAEHMVNAVFHAANAALLFIVLLLLTRSGWRSALVAAVFAWHPLRVESVAWITERKDVLSGFFFLLTLLCYAKAVNGGKPALADNSSPTFDKRPQNTFYYWLALFFLALGLMSKAMLVSMPCMLLLLDMWPLQRLFNQVPQTPGQTNLSPAAKSPWPNLKALILEKWPFFAITGLFCVLTYLVQKNYAAVVSFDKLGWNYRIANALTSYLRYLAKLFWPVDLATVYPYQRIDDWLQISLIALVLVAVSGFCVMQFKRRPWLAVGWFWYLGTSLPIIGLVQVGQTAMADRYTYLTLIGPVIALVWLIPEFWTGQARPRAIWGGGIAAVLGSLLVLTHVQIQYWHDTVSLFAHTIAVTGDNPGAESGLGIGLEHEARFSEALEHHRRALALNPDDRENHLKVGQLLMQQNQWAEAADNMFSALSLEPNDLTAHECLGSILPHLGRSEEAEQHLDMALKTAPDSPEVLNNLAWLLATCPEASVRDGKRAVQLAEQACKLTQFNKAVFLGTLAAAYAEAGRFDDAMATAQKACANASAQGETELLNSNQKLLKLYEEHQSYHETDK